MEHDEIVPDDQAIELALQRDGEIEAGAVVPLTHQELMQRLRSLKT